MTASSREQNQLRSELLEKMWVLLTSWDGTAEEALTITEENQENLIQWQRIDEQLANEESLSYTETEKKKQAEILQCQQNILNKIRSERTTVMSRMKQLNQKNKVRDNYVSVKRDSIFIDKGL